MSDAPWIAFYPSDWLAGTRGMSAAETGIYITLVAMMYERDAPLDMDERRLARLCGAPAIAFRKALDSLIDQGKILRTEAGLWNERVGMELEKRAKKSGHARESANARWQKSKGKQKEGNADAGDSQCGRNASHNHNHNHKAVAPSTTVGNASARAQDPPPAAAAAFEVSDHDMTNLERLLEAMGADPATGRIEPDGKTLGLQRDLAEAKRWSADLQLPIDRQCAVIRAIMARQGPDFRPKSFAYFTPAMAETAKGGGRSADSPQSERDKKLARWKAIAEGRI